MATEGHSLTDSVGAGEFAAGGPGGIGILQSTGDVFASDPNQALGDGTPAPRIEHYDSTGAHVGDIAVDGTAYANPGPVAVDQSGSGAVYTGAYHLPDYTGTIIKYGTDGSFKYELDASTSGTSLSASGPLAVDPSDGTVYVGAIDGTSGLPVVDEFDDTGAFVTSFDGSNGSPDGGFGCLGGLAVSASHDVYVIDSCKSRLDRYDNTGAFGATVDDGARGAPSAVAVDPTSGDVYVGESSTSGPIVTQFDSTDTFVNTFGQFAIAGLAGLAVDHANGMVDAADNAAGSIARFTSFTGPTVTATSATAITTSSATLNGTIDPGGSQAGYHFEYGLDRSYGSTTDETDAGSGNGNVAATGNAQFLSPNLTYHYRLVGDTPSGGLIVSDDRTFTTAPAPPAVDDAPAFASAITSTDATINATINPNNSQTNFHIDYGTTTAYGSSTTDSDAGSGGSDGAVTAPLAGLTPGTTYHFRVTADNGTGGAQHGQDQTFRTAPADAAGATGVTAGAATLTGVVNPTGQAATFHFNYGMTTSYGKSTPEASAGSGSADEQVTAAVNQLLPSTTYHVQVVATINGQTTTGVDGTFTTGPEAQIATPAATGVTTDAATVSTTVDTHGASGTYQFTIASQNSTYQLVTDPKDIAAADGPQPISAALTGLPSGETFRVSVLVASGDRRVSSDEITFSTAAKPTVVPTRPADFNQQYATSNAYGCAAPALNAYNQHPKPGDTITVTGADLGVGGTVALGDDIVVPGTWTAAGFTLTLPDDAAGTLPLTVNCGKVSNTIAIAMYRAPSNVFTVRTSVSGRTATVSVKVPGPGTVTVRGSGLKSVTAHAKKAGTLKVRVPLTAAGSKSLSKHHRLAARATVRFTPTGGETGSKSASLSFKKR